MSNEVMDRGNIFVWAHFGKKLQKLDKDRYLAISQNSADRYLSRIYNKNIEKIIMNMTDNNIDETIDLIEIENNLDNLFRQVALYMRGTGDLVSVGSALTGELERNVKLGRIVKKRYSEEKENENTEIKNDF